jgi:hypothetical protein
MTLNLTFFGTIVKKKASKGVRKIEKFTRIGFLDCPSKIGYINHGN